MTGALYRLLSDLGGPAIRLHLRRRLRRGKEDPARFGERLGRPGLPRPDGALVWLHAASVGESLALLPLIARLGADRPWLGLLLTSGTTTSARLLAERLPAGALHQYVPVDRRPWVRNFLDHWRPDLAIWSESELWPNLIGETRARGVPMALLDGRLSERSLRRWRRAPRLAAQLYGGFALVLAQDETQAARLRRLGAAGARCVGALKLASAALPVNAAALAALQPAVAGRAVWIAASTHAGEEAIVAAAHRAVAARRPDLLTLLAPRHATRGGEVANLLAEAGLRVARRSQGEAIGPAVEIYLVDSMGELGLFYRLAGTAFLGGSLVDEGGHNPVEPARLDCALLSGPHRDNFAAIYDGLNAAGALREVADAATLAGALAALFDDRAARDRLAAAAAKFVAGSAGVLDAVMAALAPLLDPLDRRGDARA